ncbi:MAG TPA: ABC transporter substrate-binding protein [Stellaceae bacterium]|nr:ABC transporter substrate-binding protein [Stellaceae bacterium]
MNRREFIAVLGGSAAWPLAARAQQADRVRRLGVMMTVAESDPEGQAWLGAFTQELSRLGWTEGRNLLMDVRWAPGIIDLMGTAAKELVGLQPDVILSNSTAATAAFARETQTIPIVFAIVSDPVGSGFVANLTRPGGNITGFSSLQAAMGTKWLDLLITIAPGVKRVGMMFNPDTATYLRSFYLPSVEAAAQSRGVATSLAPIHGDDEIEAIITALGREPGSGLLVMPDNFNNVHRTSIIAQAARNNIPAVYQEAENARDGGLLSYGADFSDIFRRAAGYVDRVLRGAKPADLPVQLPTKYVMVINLKTAKALGLTVPPSLLAIADEVIE